MEALQIYWWFVISLLAGLLVFLLFVQGGQTYLWPGRMSGVRSLIVNALGRKWELTFTTLVTFGGAFFASFPLYYSTSFGGAYWLWMLILLSFILQAISYEFRSKPGNIFGTNTYDIFLCFNGLVGCVLLGCAVGMQFFGADFEVSRQSILDAGQPVISRWNSMHGFDAIFNVRNLLLGLTIFFLARTTGAMFVYKNVEASDSQLWGAKCRSRILSNGAIFALLFVAFAVVLLVSDGYAVGDDGHIVAEPYKYLHNFVQLWWIGAAFLIGVVAVLYGIIRAVFDPGFRGQAFWWTAAGVVVTVTSLFCISGYNGTAFLPSLSHPDSSLTLANSSSTYCTLKTMTWVTVLLPVVIFYIAVVWKNLTSPAITDKEVSSGESY